MLKRVGHLPALQKEKMQVQHWAMTVSKIEDMVSTPKMQIKSHSGECV